MIIAIGAVSTVLLLLGASPGWTTLGTTEGGPLEVKTPFPAMVGGHPRLWVKSNTSQLRVPDDTGVYFDVTSTLSLQEYDCQQGRLGTVQITYYGTGKNTTRNASSTAWSYPAPDTVGEAVERAACSKAVSPATTAPVPSRRTLAAPR